MNELKSKGFILRRIQTQEADLIIKIMTSNGEKISAYGRSALKSKKRFEGGLQVLSQIEFRTHKKESSELWMLEESKLTFEFKNIPTNVESYAVANYLSELTEHCAHEGLENAPLYNLFGAALKALDMGREPHGVLACFEAKLLSLMGWMPDLNDLESVEQEIWQKLLSQKISEIESQADFKKLNALESRLKAHILSHVGHGKLKSLDFLAATL